MSTTTVTGTIHGVNNSALANKSIKFRLLQLGTDSSSTVTVAQSSSLVQTDASGNFSVDIWDNGGSGKKSILEITVKGSRAEYVIIPENTASIELWDLIENYQADGSSSEQLPVVSDLFLRKDANLSDLGDAATARANLGQFTEENIGDNAVALSKLGVDVDLGQVNDLAVTPTKIADDAVIEDKLATGAVTANKLATGAVVPNKLSAGGPTWSSQALSILGDGGSGGLEINSDITGYGNAFIDLHSTDVSHPDFDARIIHNDTGELDFYNARNGDFRVYGSDGLAPRAAISDAGIRYNKAGGSNTFAFKWDGNVTSGYQVIARVDNNEDVALVSTASTNKIKMGWNTTNVTVNIDNALDVVLISKATFDALEARVAALENP